MKSCKKQLTAALEKGQEEWGLATTDAGDPVPLVKMLKWLWLHGWMHFQQYKLGLLVDVHQGYTVLTHNQIHEIICGMFTYQHFGMSMTQTHIGLDE